MNATELLDQFVLEARECLETIGRRLLEVERDPANAELLNDLFRQVHTLKGNCGLFEFKALEHVVHAGEDLLDRVRHGQLCLRRPDRRRAARSHGLQRRVDRRHLRPRPAARGCRRTCADPGGSAAAPPAIDRHAGDCRGADRGHPCRAAGLAGACAGRVVPAGPRGAALPARAGVLLQGRGPLAPGPQHARSAPPGCGGAAEPWPAAEVFDCYRCNLDLLLVSDAPARRLLLDHFRYVPEQVELCALTTPLPQPAGESAPLRLLRQRTAELWDVQRSLLASPG
jgi:two-component system chemotaxis sensor kinase CheA